MKTRTLFFCLLMLWSMAMLPVVLQFLFFFNTPSTVAAPPSPAHLNGLTRTAILVPLDSVRPQNAAPASTLSDYDQ